MGREPLICWCIVLFFPLLVQDDAIAGQNGWQIYVDSLQSQHQVLIAEHAIEQHRFSAFDQLYQRGHASWLEQRKQKLKLDESDALVRAFGNCVSVVRDLRNEQPNTDSQMLRFGKLMFTDLPLVTATESPKNELHSQLDRLRKTYAQSKQEADRLAVATANLLPDEAWKQLAILRATREAKAAAWLASQIRLVEFQIQSHETQGDRLAARQKSLKPMDASIRSAIEKQCDLQRLLIEHVDDFENQRLMIVRELEATGHGSPSDAAKIGQHLAELNERQRIHDQVVELLSNDADKSNYVVHRPTLGLVADGGIASQIQSQMARGESEFQIQASKLNRAMLNEVLSRLLAAQTPEMTTEGYRSIASAKQKEIEHYRWRIKLMELEEQLAKARLNAISAVDGKFVVMDQTKHQVTQRIDAPTQSLVGLASVSLLNQILISTGTARTESVERESTSRVDFDRLVTGLSRYPSVHFNSFDPLYRPVSLTNGRRSFSSYRSNYSGRSSLTNSSLQPRFRSPISSRYATQQRYNQSRLGSNHYGSYSRFPARAYPFGNLDSSLRRFTTPAQPPWLLPGSPTNLRPQQLRTNIGRDSFGRTGNQLLKTRIYTDIYRQ